MIASNWKRQVFLMELRKLIAYRLDFWVNFLGQTVFSLVIAYFLWSSIFSYAQTDTIKGHNIDYMMFYYLVVPLIFRIEQGQGIGYLATEIYDGKLNKYLLYPIDVFQYKLRTYFANSFFFFLQMIVIIMIYNTFFYSPDVYNFSFTYSLAFIISLITGTLCFFYLFTLGELMAFWFDNTWSLGVIIRFFTSFLGGALIPLAFFPAWAQEVLSYTPFPYLINFPLQCLVGNITLSQFFFSLAICISYIFLFKALVIFTWKKGQKGYTGVGI